MDISAIHHLTLLASGGAGGQSLAAQFANPTYATGPAGGNWEIYSLGDAGYLNVVLNAVAMYTGTGSFQWIVSIGFILGVIMTLIRALANGAKSLDLQYFVLSLVFFGFMFGAKTTVDIHDPYTDNDYTVANVPIGVAVIGSVSSTISHNIESSLTTDFSMPSMAANGFANAPRLLQKVGRLTTFGPAAQAPNGQRDPTDPTHPYDEHVDTAFQNYMRDCVTPAGENGFINLQQAYNNPSQESFWANLNVPDHRSSTVLPIYPNGSAPPGNTGLTSQGATMYCDDAYTALTNMLSDSNFTTLEKAYLDSKLGSNSVANITQTLQDMDSGPNSTQQVMLDGIGYANNAILSYIMEHAELGADQGKLTPTNVMMAQAIAQRDVSWSAEGGMFLTVVRPIMAFFEGLFYCLVPIIGFLIGMGQFGHKLLVDFIKLALWVQAMPPIMAIVNLYYNYVAQDQVSTAISGGLDFSTVAGMLAMAPHYDQWVATAGMLAGAVPVIAATLVYGGSFAATSLAGRLAGGEKVDEKIQMPDSVKPAAVTTFDTASTATIAKAHAYTTGADKIVNMPQLEFAALSAQSSALSNVQSSSESLSKSALTSITNAASHTDQAQMMDTLAHGYETTRDQLYKTNLESIQKYGSKLGWSSSQERQLAAITTSQMSAGVSANASEGLKLFGDGATTQQSMAHSDSISGRSASLSALQQELNFNQEKATSASTSNSDQTSLAEKSAYNLAQQLSHADAHTLTKQFGETFNKQVSDVIKSEHSYQQSSQLSDKFKMPSADIIENFINRAANHGGGRIVENILAKSPELRKAFNEELSYTGKYYTSRNEQGNDERVVANMMRVLSFNPQILEKTGADGDYIRGQLMNLVGAGEPSSQFQVSDPSNLPGTPAMPKAPTLGGVTQEVLSHAPPQTALAPANNLNTSVPAAISANAQALNPENGRAAVDVAHNNNTWTTESKVTDNYGEAAMRGDLDKQGAAGKGVPTNGLPGTPPDQTIIGAEAVAVDKTTSIITNAATDVVTDVIQKGREALGDPDH